MARRWRSRLDAAACGGAGPPVPQVRPAPNCHASGATADGAIEFMASRMKGYFLQYSHTLFPSLYSPMPQWIHRTIQHLANQAPPTS